MQFTFVVCNDQEIMDRGTREVLGRIRSPRWYGDFWRASVAGGHVEEPTQAQLRVAIQKRIDRLADPADPLDRRAPDAASDPDEPLRPRRPSPRKPDHVKTPQPGPSLPPPLVRPVNYAMKRRVRVFAQRAGAIPETPSREDKADPTRAKTSPATGRG